MKVVNQTEFESILKRQQARIASVQNLERQLSDKNHEVKPVDFMREVVDGYLESIEDCSMLCALTIAAVSKLGEYARPDTKSPPKPEVH